MVNCTFCKFNLSKCCLRNIQTYLSTFNIIHTPDCAKLNARELHWSYQGHTLKGFMYEKTAVLLWIDLKGKGTEPANSAEDHLYCLKTLLENAGSGDLKG